MRFSSILKITAITVGSLSVLASCKEKKESTNTDANVSSTTTVEANENGVKIAYINVDTLESQYAYFKTSKDKFEQQQKAIENELAKLQKDIQNQYMALQKKVQEKNISQEEYEKTGVRIQSMEKNYEQKAGKHSEDMYKRTEAFQKEYKSKLDEALKAVNKDGKYDFILNYQEGTPFILHVNPKYDITSEVLTILNNSATPAATTTDSTAK